MSLLHPKILSPEQSNLSRLLREARGRGFYMVGGTATALHLSHRKSIDFDLFRDRSFSRETTTGIFQRSMIRMNMTQIDTEENLTGIAQGVKITFFYFHFPIEATIDFQGDIKIPTLLTLAAMKAYALGRRAKWKDYVDLYFIMHDYYTLSEIIQKSQEIFGVYFQSAQFIEQLAYHEHINYDEVVEYLIPDPPTDAQVKAFLIERAIED